MSPTAKMPGTLVWNFSVSTWICFFSSARPHSAIGPSLGDRPKNTSTWSAGTTRVTPSPPVIFRPLSASSPSSRSATWPTMNCIS